MATRNDRDTATTFKKYLSLTKPGIVRGNMITATGGFLFASKGSINLVLLLSMFVGLSSVIAAGCVFNNVIDQDIDAKMKRTQKRALVTGEVSSRAALVFGSVLLVLGFVSLLLFTNVLAAFTAIFGFLAYVVLYGYFKRTSIYGTEVGSISGAVPPVVGYVSVRGSFDGAALLLFIILIAWQMPHFFAIGIFRAKEYKQAKLPIRSVVKGAKNSANLIILYVIMFIIITPTLTLWDYAGWTYLIVMMATGLYWLSYGLKRSRHVDTIKWSKGMFGISLLVLLVFSAIISLDAWLP